MIQRIGIVTGGGDCPGLNTVIRAVSKAAAQRGWETFGFLGGYGSLLEPGFTSAGKESHENSPSIANEPSLSRPAP